jgi:hypothetical protein
LLVVELVPVELTTLQVAVAVEPVVILIHMHQKILEQLQQLQVQ